MKAYLGANTKRCSLSNVIFDSTGNLYGTTSSGGPYGAGVVWEITPQVNKSLLQKPIHAITKRSHRP